MSTLLLADDVVVNQDPPHQARRVTEIGQERSLYPCRVCSYRVDTFRWAAFGECLCGEYLYVSKKSPAERTRRRGNGLLLWGHRSLGPLLGVH